MARTDGSNQVVLHSRSTTWSTTLALRLDRLCHALSRCSRYLSRLVTTRDGPSAFDTVGVVGSIPIAPTKETQW